MESSCNLAPLKANGLLRCTAVHFSQRQVNCHVKQRVTLRQTHEREFPATNDGRVKKN